VNVLVAAVESGCERVVLTGSLEEPDAGEPVPTSPYAAAKLGATAYGHMVHAVYGLPVVTARLFMVYGPGQQDRTKLVPYVVTSLLRGDSPRLSSGVRPVDWLFVDDAVDGLLAAARTPESAGREDDIGTGELVTVREVVEGIAAAVGTQVEPEFGAVQDRRLERVRAADVESTESLIGWRAKTPLADGLRATVEWYREAEA
jgi:nucleoside-diphosphate-sugar epimerase